MKVGDQVRYIKKGWIGIVIAISPKTLQVLVDFSDRSGILCRSGSQDELELLNENR